MVCINNNIEWQKGAMPLETILQMGWDVHQEDENAIRFQFLRAALVSHRFASVVKEIRRQLVLRTHHHHPHPLAALSVTRCPWSRVAVWSPEALRRMRIDSSPKTMAALLNQYGEWMDYNMLTTLRRYERRLMIAPREGRARGPFTYQVLHRYQKRDGAEAASRRFLMLPDGRKALQFCCDFWTLQATAPNDTKITVLECGTFDESWRKWVLDIDAPHAEMLQAGLDVADSERCVRELAWEISRALHAMGFLHRPCPFAVLSRHNPDRKKCSWHVTLCAFAGYARWRDALRRVLDYGAQQSAPSWRMLPMVDDSTLRNSHSQYIQIWGSTKVEPGKPCDGRCFCDKGLWASVSTPIAIPTEHRMQLLGAATSLMLHDPWSIPFIGVTATSTLDVHERVLKDAPTASPAAAKRARIDAPPKTPFEKPGSPSWSDLPRCAAWMRSFVDATDGSTRLHTIPSMMDSRNWPRAAQRPGAKRLLYAQVSGCACCPRMLVGFNELHKHGSNTTMLYCFEDPAGHARMLMRCFSTHCLVSNDVERTKRLLEHGRLNANHGWIEIEESDWHVLQILRGDVAKKQVFVCDANRLAVDIQLAKRDQWIGALWHNTNMMACELPLPPPRSLEALLPVSGRIRIHFCARYQDEPPFCPRLLAAEKAVRRHKDPSLFLEPCVILFVEERSPRCAGVSMRVFMRCVHTECVRIGETPWTELSRSMLQSWSRP